MKYSLIFIIALYSILNFNCTSNKNNHVKNGKEEMGLLGRVKKVTIQNYKYNFNEKRKEHGESYSFDETGNTIEETFTSKTGSLTKSSYKYDDKGYLIEKTNNEDGSSTKYIYKNELDGMGNLIQQSKYYSNGNLIEQSKYDNKGNNFENNNYSGDGKLYLKRTFSYDDKGNLLESSTYDSNGKLCTHILSKYDKNGNLIEQSEDRQGKHTCTYEFDETGNWSKRKVHRGEDILFEAEQEITYYE